MPEYADITAFHEWLNWLEEISNSSYPDHQTLMIYEIRDELDCLPKVVRCKDCRYYHADTLSCDFTPHGKYYERPNWYEEDFCSYGERRIV